MVATTGRTVTVFGGTGFLGRRIVRHLRARGFPVRIASRHPDRGHTQFGPDDPLLQFVEARIHDQRSVADACLSEIKHAHTDDGVRQEMAWAQCDQRHVLFAASGRPC
jgi:nucleoside-diphosphate-sugar epimerase